MKKFFLFLFVCANLFANTPEQIKESGVLRIGVNPDPLGMPFIEDEDGQYKGFLPDMVRAISNKIFGSSVKVEFVQLPTFKDRLTYLNDNKIDIVLMQTKSASKEKEMAFTLPYMTNVISVISRKGEIKDKSDLAGKTFTFKPGTSLEAWFKKSKYSSNPSVYCNTNPECIDFIKTKKADVFIELNFLVAQFPVFDSSLERPIKGISDFRYSCMTTQLNNTKLRDDINKALIALSKEGFFKKQYEDAFNPFYKGSLEKKYVLIDDLYKAMY